MCYRVTQYEPFCVESFVFKSTGGGGVAGGGGVEGGGSLDGGITSLIGVADTGRFDLGMLTWRSSTWGIFGLSDTRAGACDGDDGGSWAVVSVFCTLIDGIKKRKFNWVSGWTHSILWTKTARFCHHTDLAKWSLATKWQNNLFVVYIYFQLRVFQCAPTITQLAGPHLVEWTQPASSGALHLSDWGRARIANDHEKRKEDKRLALRGHFLERSLGARHELDFSSVTICA